MIASILIGGIVFGYAGWAFIRHINKSKQGKCGGCSIKSSCSTNCGSGTDKV